MKEQLITFDTAKLAKEKGFNLESPAYYSCDEPASKRKGNQLCIRTWVKYTDIGNEMTQEWTMIYSAPAQSLLQKWLWERHTIWVDSKPFFNANELMGVEVNISSWKFPYITVDYNGYDIYEGLEKGLEESLKLIK